MVTVKIVREIVNSWLESFNFLLIGTKGDFLDGLVMQEKKNKNPHYLWCDNKKLHSSANPMVEIN